jgi:hypothetical protein
MSAEGDFSEYRDEFGMRGPLPASDGQRMPPAEGFFTGPEIGRPLPGFELRSTTGGVIDLHVDRGNAKAAVVFFRSAVW